MPRHPSDIAHSLAAIDAGSNGIRLVIGEMTDGGEVTGLQTWRAAVRLGEDVFRKGAIGDATADAAVVAFKRFARLIKLQQIRHVRAVATSAMREATNGAAVAKRITEATGLRVQIIDGLEEAELAFEAVADTVELDGHTGLMIDMGGGSVEVTVASGGRPMASQSLRLGPVRLLEKLREEKKDEDHTVELIRRYRGTITGMIDNQLDGHPPELSIGIGGNIECLGKLRVPLLDKKKAYKVKLADLGPMTQKLLGMSRSERREKLGLRRDRADVIAIAAIVLRFTMEEAGVTRLIIPRVGVKDGLLKQMAREICRGR